MLEDKYGNSTEIRLFYTTESFTVRDGNHNHFVLYISNPELHYAVKKDMTEYIGTNITDIKPYDEDLPCIFYSSKKGLEGIAWDILGNDLKKDGLENANKGNR